MKSQSTVWCKLPNAGLGNQLFPLLRAFVFASINNLPVVVTNYHQFRIGPYLRNEKIKRDYKNIFVFQKNILGEWIDRRKVDPKRFSKVVLEPKLERVTDVETLFVFDQIPHWKDYFVELREHRALVLNLFSYLIKPEIRDRLGYLASPEIGVHIRMGDFRKLKANEDFSKLGSVRTPHDYFIQTIKAVQSVTGECKHVFVFSDGRASELRSVLELPRVKLIEGNADIVDLLLLSKSQVIITSAGSTFSYWAGFLSEAQILLHPDHIHAPIRASNNSLGYFEGSVDEFEMKTAVK